MTDASQLPRLLQLCSQALPVGAYAYSQGLESAIAAGLVTDPDSARHWIGGVLHHGLAQLDIPAMFIACEAWKEGDEITMARIDEYVQASRETRELLLEDVEMGRSLHRLLMTLEVPCPPGTAPSFVTRFAAAGVAWKIPFDALASGFCFSWIENQLAVAIKSVPLGQSDAQRILGSLIPDIETAVSSGTAIGVKAGTDDWQFGISLPGLAILSSSHEEMDGRLYRS